MECKSKKTVELSILENKKEINSYVLYMPKSISCLEKAGESLQFPKDHIFIEPGQCTRYCYIVKKGRVLAYEDFRNGEERIYHIHEKNALFLESNLLFEKPTPVGFRTAVSTEVLRIDRNTLIQALKTDHMLAYQLLESTSHKFFSAMQQVCYVKNYSIMWKICDLFLSFVDYYGIPQGKNVMLTEKFSQQTIANMLGINRITAVRSIKKLKDMGLLEQKRGQRYSVDVEGLRKYQQSLE